MSRNKYTFAQELLRSYKLTSEQKERVLALIARERNEDIAQLEERIATLEKSITTSIEEGASTEVTMIENTPKQEESIVGGEDKENKENKENKEISIHYKKIDKLPKFLSELNRGTFTKYLTHEIDETDYKLLKEKLGGSYTHQKHLEQIKKDFEELSKKDFSFDLDPQFYSKIRNYIYGEGGWSEKSIRMNWSHPELLEWLEVHPNDPAAPGTDLQKELFDFKIDGETKTFSDLVTIFKNQIHIRAQNSIKNLIERLNRSRKYDIEYDEICKRLNFYTDVEKLRQIFNICFKWIEDKKKEKNKISIKVEVSDTNIYIRFIHYDTIFEQAKDTLRYGNSCMNLMELANGICDISIITQFQEGKGYEEWPIWKDFMSVERGKVYGSNKQKELDPEKVLKPSPQLELPDNCVVYLFKFDRGL